MYIQQDYKLEFRDPKIKILQLIPAFNHTFVILSMDKFWKRSFIYHVDSRGKKLFKYTFDDVIYSITMTNDRTLAHCDIEKDMLIFIDLESKQAKRAISYEFVSKYQAAVFIDFFPQTQLTVIIEQGQTEQPILRLTYFKENEEVSISRYIASQDQYQHGDMVKRGNSHSMFIWGKKCLEYQSRIELWLYDLREELPQGIKRFPRKLVVQIAAPVLAERIVSVISVWETREDQYLLCCHKNLIYQNLLSTNFIFSAKTGHFRECEFMIEQVDNQHIFDQQSFGTYSIFPSRKTGTWKHFPSVMHIVRNDGEREVAQTMWCTNHCSQYFGVPYDPNGIILAEYDSDEALMANVKHIRMPSLSFEKKQGQDVLTNSSSHLNSTPNDKEK